MSRDSMDSSGYWITVGLLLVVCLPQHSCDDPVVVECGIHYNAQDQYFWTIDNCSCTNCIWSDGSSRKLDLQRAAPVTVDLKLRPDSSIPHASIPPAYQQVDYDPGKDCRTDQVVPSTNFQLTGSNFYEASVTFNKSSGLLILPTGYLFCKPESFIQVEVWDPPGKSGRGLNGVALGVGLAGGVVVMIVVAVICMRKRLLWHKLRPINSSGSKDGDFNSANDLSDLEVGAPHHYSYKELSAATHSFDSKYVVGEGGFGTVYKGVLKDTGFPVAIKRLSQYARQGAREFMAEVKIISQLRHRNLVQLLGWCLEKDELILVYEYMPNGDLDDLIYADKPKCDLSWKQRYNILCGVAQALVYLHEEWEQRVVHRDVKTSNVMLDSALNARLGDFGLARLSAHSQAPQSTLVAGTLGYLAPEFSLSGKATDKTDVYAFGVVMLEVTCARRPLSPDCILVDWVWDLHKNEKLFDAVDPKLDVRSSDDEVQMKVVLQVGLLCAHPDLNARPSMRQVLNMLRGEASIPRVPRSKPVASYFEDMD